MTSFKQYNSTNEKCNLSKQKIILLQRYYNDIFPNVCIAYRLFLTILVANCEAERSFSVLKRIKNLYRSSMLDSCLSSLSRLAIKTELLKTLDFDDVLESLWKKMSEETFINKIK